MTKLELLEILKSYPDDTNICIEWAPGSGNYSETIQYAEGYMKKPGGDLLDEDDWEPEEEEGPFPGVNTIVLYPHSEPW